MSAQILKVKEELTEVGLLLSQGQITLAIAQIQAAVDLMLQAVLGQHDWQTLSYALDQAIDFLAQDQEVQSIFPLPIVYKPGQEKDLKATLDELWTVLEDQPPKSEPEPSASWAQIKEPIAQAQAALEDGNLDWAEQICTHLQQKYPEDHGLNKTMAHIFLDREYYDQALKFLKNAYVSKKQAALVFNNIGMYLRKAGHWVAAEKFYLQALEYEPKNAYLYFNLGRVYLGAQQWKNALAAAELALALDSQLVAAQKLKTLAAQNLDGPDYE